MKDLISKVTFGFLMAQFVPGAITVSAIGFLCAAFALDTANSIQAIGSAAVKTWGTSVEAKIILVLMCTGAGMLIHGIHWAVLAFIETFGYPRKNGQETRREIYETFWQDRRIFLQILLGPIKALLEILGFLLLGRSTQKLATEENVPHIDEDRMDAFNFLQDFYLHFAQFYAHTSYALLVSFVCLTVFVCRFGFSGRRFCLLIAIHVLCGLFFVLGRIQLSTLFIAEHQLRNNEGADLGKGVMKSDKKPPAVSLEPMSEGDMEEAVSLISAAMNENEAGWAQETFEFYFACEKHGLESGREYYVWRRSGEVCGLVGLHRYRWGPRENVWLSWFAVHPRQQRQGFGRALIAKIVERAQGQGYKKLLVETYGGSTFDKARSFYRANGFCEWGRVRSYLPDGAAMIVFGKEV